MVKEKIVSIKRNILLVIIHYLYNLEINSNLFELNFATRLINHSVA